MYKIPLAKALVLVSLVMLVALYTFKKIISHNRLQIFRAYSHITLPPLYEIKRNAAGTGNNQTDVWLVFGFDEENFRLLLQQNKINGPAADINQAHPWLKKNHLLLRKTTIDSLTTVLEAINLKRKTLEFRYKQALGSTPE